MDRNVTFWIGLALLVVLALVAGGCAQLGRAIRVGLVQPAINEDLAWVKMFEKYGIQLAPTRVARAGALAGFVVVEYKALPLPMRESVDAILYRVSDEEKATPEYQQGYDAGTRVNLYLQASGEGLTAFIGALKKFGIKV